MLSTGFKLPQKGILIGIQVRLQPSGGPLASCPQNIKCEVPFEQVVQIF